jgi:hypothetical protein
VHELAFEDLILGQIVLTFDGHVVELFRQGVGSVKRIHVRQLICEATGPTGRGNYQVKFSVQPWGGGFDLAVAPETWVGLQPVIAAIYAAQTGHRS